LVARGFARGLARIIKSQNDAYSLKKGEVAVLAQDVFLPLVLDKAGAIILVQDKLSPSVEQQVRNHETPCVTGVKEALTGIQEGNMIEVRANHRTVRVLK